ncbi:uncharacterized protein LOC130725526 [Lotus japonicus]|uniref:uncharacterized protein LOC130725526 n=1 Tax=Lotus japonicus TaxID=34305 RepID=UPI00258D122A|nr:uncharacterized protein LOC130725526 [Lotus japonicus]
MPDLRHGKLGGREMDLDSKLEKNSVHLGISLTGGPAARPGFNSAFLWSRGPLAPSNILAFSWRVLLDRIQTKENLKKRGIIQPGQQSNCVFCHNQEESLSHLSFSCKFAWEVWSRTFKWLGIVTVQHSDANLHFLQHGNILASHSCNGWWVIWAAVVWSIWILRNDIVFNSGSACVDKIMDIIQFRYRTVSFVDVSSGALGTDQGLLFQTLVAE